MPTVMSPDPDTPGPIPAPGSSRGLDLALLGVALAVVFSVLRPVLDAGLVYDDLWLVAQNPTIRSLERLPEALTGAYWDFLDPESAARIGYWRPLTAVALFVGHALGGGAPWAFHAVSLALHLAAVAGVFFLARRLARDSWVAFATALLFGVHPAQVEPVAWISSVNDPLHGLALILGLGAFLRWRERGSVGWPLAACTCLAIGLCAKENAAAFVPLALALDLGRRPSEAERARRSDGAGALAPLLPFRRAYLPFLAVGLAYYLARVAVFGDLGAGFDRITGDLNVGLWRQLTLRTELLGGALELLVWPAQLNLFREVRPVVPPLDGTVLIAAACIAAWLALVWVLWRRDVRPLLAGVLMMPAGILPALLRLESLGRFPLSERFLYVSIFGVAFALALVCLQRLPRTIGAPAVGLLVLAGAWYSHGRTAFWQDEESVFRGAVEASPRSPYVWWGLGRVMLERYRESGDARYLVEAGNAFLTVKDFAAPEDGSKPDPQMLITLEDILQANLGEAWFTLLCALDRNQELCTVGEAKAQFDMILERYPRSDAALVGQGVSSMYEGDLFNAEKSLRAALELNPKHREAWYDLGQVLMRARRWDEAGAAFERALELRDGDETALVDLARAWIESDRGDRARRVLSEALARFPRSAPVRLQLGTLAGREGRFEKAVEFADEALRLDGSLGPAHLLRAKAQFQLGDVQDSIRSYQEACRWMPQSFESHYTLGVILLQQGLEQDARRYLERAIQIDPNNELVPLIREELDGR